MKCFSLLLTVALLTAYMSSAQAIVVFSDDFSEVNGTPLLNKTPDVGLVTAAWNIGVGRGIGQTIQGGVVDTFTNPNSDSPTSYAFFTGNSAVDSFTPLATGQTLRFSFETVSGGGPFHGGSFATLDLYTGPTQRFFIGSTAGNWRVGGSAVPAAEGLTSVVGAAQNGIFNYAFDSGDWNVSFNGGSTYASSGTTTPGLAFNRARIAASLTQDIAVDSLSIDISTAPAPLPSVPAAFVGAVGQGAAAAGGRGGDVYRVTTLADYGAFDAAIPGSLRDAIDSAIGPRTIVFDVSGALELSRILNVNNNNLTIAGQTSPAGITVHGYPTFVAGDDIILRHMRFRTTDLNGGEGNFTPDGADALSIVNSNRVILDSVSTSWGIDENLSVTLSKDVTVQNSIISEGLNDNLHSTGPHSRGSLVRGQLTAAEQIAGTGGITFSGNLWASNVLRNPGVGGEDGGPGSTDVNIVNNVIYNFGDAAINREGLGSVRANVVGNYFISGPQSPGNDVVFEEGVADTTEVYQEGNFRDSDQDAIHDGSLISNAAAAQAAAFTGFSGADMLLNSSTGSAFNFFSSVAADVLSAEDAYTNVVNSVGASLWRDVIDTRIIAELEGRTGGIIDSQEIFRSGGILAGIDDLPTTTRAAGFDTDGDGMPNAFETLNGLDPNNPDDRNFVDISLVGYTNLEVYLNSLTALAGDFDEDGDVDGFDFLTWQRGFGTTFTAGDLTDWATNFGTDIGPLAAGSGLAASAAAVPEPSTAMLLSLALAGLAASRRRRR